MGWCSLLEGFRSSSQSLDQLALLFREFWRISWRFRGGGGDEFIGIFDYRFPWLTDLLNCIYLLLFCRHSYFTCILVLSFIRLKFKVRR